MSIIIEIGKDKSYMKIIKYKGGLGNQMFQYAFAVMLKEKYKQQVKMDLSAYQHNSNLAHMPRINKMKVSLERASSEECAEYCLYPQKDYASKWLYRSSILMEALFNKKYYYEFDCKFKNIDALLNYDYYDGYWQSWKYVHSVEAILRTAFTPLMPLTKKAEDDVKQIKKENAIFIGVRKGDYTSTFRAKWEYGSFDSIYYRNAMNYICDRLVNPIFYVFSNDIEWVKRHLDFSGFNIVYRENDEQTDDFEELVIMGHCKHAIIVNSTFHWWGAWLISNPEKIIIAPAEWFANKKEINIIPPEWVRF